MLTFDLNTATSYNEGSTTVGTIKDISGGIIPDGVVDAVHKLFGGVDFEKEVVPDIEKKIQRNFNHVNNYYLSDASVSPAYAMTRSDAYLTSVIQWVQGRRDNELKSSAWKAGYDIWLQNLRGFLKQLRATAGFDVKIVTKDLTPYNILNYKMEKMRFPYGKVLPHGVYTAKQGVSEDLKRVQAIKPTTTTQQANYIPQTDTSGSSNNDKPMSGGLIGGILAVVAVVIGGIIYLIKK